MDRKRKRISKENRIVKKRKRKDEDNDIETEPTKLKFVDLPLDIIEYIIELYFESYLNHKCRQEHKWCFNIKVGHQYNRNKISILTNICREFTRIAYRHIWKTIELNRKFSTEEQKRTLKFVELFSDDDFIGKNYIKNIIINNNFSTNNTLLNIIKTADLSITLIKTIVKNINSHKLILDKQNFNSGLLINFYQGIGELCFFCGKEPCFWDSIYYWQYCLKCMEYKFNIKLSRHNIDIIKKSISVEDLFYL